MNSIGKNITEKLTKYKTTNRPKSYVNLQKYMLDNAVYFYDASLPSVTPVRSESSRTDYEDEVRHRGSVIDLEYSSPDKFMIEEQKTNRNSSPDNSRLSNKFSGKSEDSMR